MVTQHPFEFQERSILGSTMGRKGDRRGILRLFEQGKLRPVLDRRLPMTEVATAHRLRKERQALGKLVLVP